MKIDEDLAEIMGIHIGDGCISENSRYSEYYLGGDLTEEREYHDTWVGPLFNKKILIPFFRTKANYKEHPKVGIYGFHIFNKKLTQFFNSLGIESGPKLNVCIPPAIMKSKKLLKRFLRGLFDTDGSLYFDKNYSAKIQINNHPIIKLGTVSEKLAKDVFNSLKWIGLNPRIKNPYKGKRDKHKVHTVLIYRKQDIQLFIDKIGFKNSKHYTKWQVFKKIGYCPANTKLQQRKEIINASKTL